MIRGIQLKDVEEFWNMQYELDKETKYMMFEDGERIKNLDAVQNLIKSSMDGSNLLLVAEVNQQIVGFISAKRGGPNRIKHTAYIVVGIRKQYQGIGIGTEFFKQLDEWASANNVKRLELTVMEQNTIAKHLYEKNGFVVEGIKKMSMLVDGVFIDEFYMAKIL